jgi:RNA 2',3'-cyclic 3'-phosphodiesterase
MKRRQGTGSDSESKQLPLDLGGTPPKQPPQKEKSKWVPPRGDEVFATAVPDTAVTGLTDKLVATLREQYGLRGKTRPYHVSLNYIGTIPGLSEEVLFAVKQALATVVAAPFSVTFDRLLRFPGEGQRAVVLQCGDGTAALTALLKALDVAMADAGLKRRANSGFTPHMTLLYDEREVPEILLREPIVWTVREFVLVRSLYGRGRHEYLGRWPLR